MPMTTYSKCSLKFAFDLNLLRKENCLSRNNNSKHRGCADISP